MARIRGLQQIYQSQDTSDPLLRVAGGVTTLTFLTSAINFEKDGVGSLLQVVDPNKLLFTINGGLSYVIGTDSADGSDNRQLTLSGSGAASETRSGYITIGGNEHATSAGDIDIVAGNVSGGNLTLKTTNASSNIYFYTNDIARWSFDSSGNLLPVASVTYSIGSPSFRVNAIYANSIDVLSGVAGLDQVIYTGIASLYKIRADTSDASDTKAIQIAGGGDTTVSRGGVISIYGNEHANTGRIDISAGNVAGGVVNLLTGGLNRWSVDASGRLAGDATNGSEIVISSSNPNNGFNGIRGNVSSTINMAITPHATFSNSSAQLSLNGSTGNVILSSGASFIALRSNDATVGATMVSITNPASLFAFTNDGKFVSRNDNNGGNAFQLINGTNAGITKIAGGAAAALANGALITLFGTTAAGTPDTLQLSAGSSTATASVALSAPGTSGLITLSTNGTIRWQVNASGQLTPPTDNSFALGSSTTNAQNVFTYGVGNGANSSLNIFANNLNRWSFTPAGLFLQDPTNGSDIVFNRTIGLIRQNTSAASDTNSLQISSAGATGPTRGAYAQFFGNNHATAPGEILIQMGNSAANGKGIVFQLGTTSGSRIAFANSGGSHQLLYDNNNGFQYSTNIKQNSTGVAIILNTSNPSPSGTTQASAIAGVAKTQWAGFNTIGTITQGTNDAIYIPTDIVSQGVTGQIVVNGTDSFLQIFPPTSGTINNQAINEPFLLGPRETIEFYQAVGAAANRQTSKIENTENGFKNTLINGDFQIWQRGTSFPVIANGAYFADRWQYNSSGTMVHTITRDTNLPTMGQTFKFVNYSTKLACTTAQASIGTGEYVYISQKIEGVNFAYLAQRKFNLSFWVYATKPGVYSVSLQNTAQDRSYVVNYTITTTNTWQRIVLPILATPSAGTWDYSTGIGLRVNFPLAAGSPLRTSTLNTWQSGNFLTSTTAVNGVDSTSDDFQIAMVQIELGHVMTRFAQRPIDVELAMCQRYYEKSFNQATAPANNADASTARIGVAYFAGATWIQPETFQTLKRATPTVTLYNPSSGTAGQVRNSSQSADGTTSSAVNISERGFGVSTVTPASTTIGDSMIYHWDAVAEL